ncbi:MAG: preprotein translocase subunit SecE [Phycisphaerae bacterium]|nr:preprotein translocase subunit SecE [Phycisphaerae bacterium]
MAKTRDPKSGLEDERMAPVATAANEPDDDDDGAAPLAPPARVEAPSRPGGRRGFFDIYKPAQGYYTRIGTAFGLGILILWSAAFVYDKMTLLGTGPTAQYIQAGSTVAVILGFGFATYYALALNRRFCDFLIATEGEMKKVNWTSRKEIIGSTKVVIFVVLSLAVFLFVADVALMLFFSEIKVLRIVPEILGRLFGSGST